VCPIETADRAARIPEAAHRQLRQAGNEAASSEDLAVNARGIARGLWAETHLKPRAAKVVETSQ